MVRKKGRSPLIFQFHCAAPTVPLPCKCLELAFFLGGVGVGVGGGVGVLRNFRLNLLVRKQGVSIDRGTGCGHSLVRLFTFKCLFPFDFRIHRFLTP